ncbi:hypothetical protein [Methylogaea oryzae]|uniref:hypothetical protein n=1 Tax=Methylogaea oryzae TaxID=1295382 RepID=UPI000B012C83|nr:hypothetical protein [Methylogaea oryzae]
MSASATFVLKRHSVLPGFGITLGFTLLYLALIVLIPLSAAFLKTAALTWAQFWSTVTSPRVVASYRLTFGASLAAATVNAVFGLLVAWVLARYRFPGKRVVDALVDLPSPCPRRWPASPWPPSIPATAGSAACWRPWASRWLTRRWGCSWR